MSGVLGGVSDEGRLLHKELGLETPPKYTQQSKNTQPTWK